MFDLPKNDGEKGDLRAIMTDPGLQAAMHLLSVLTPPAYFTDLHLFSLLVCRMVNVSMRHGTSGASAHAYGILGHILGPVFHRYSEGYRFAKLACDLVEKHGFIAYHTKVYHAMGSLLGGRSRSQPRSI
jgi:predicted ATPase